MYGRPIKIIYPKAFRQLRVICHPEVIGLGLQVGGGKFTRR